MELRRVTAHVPVEVTDSDRDAAVLVPVVERSDGDYLVFTKRADHLGEHPGQMSFPGGGRETDDPTLGATAIREANEEIGLEPGEVVILGQLDDIHTVTGYAVTPFVGLVADRRYAPDEREVAEVVALPVAELADPDNHEWEYRSHPAFGEVVVDYFHVDGYTVWGATARILAQLLELVVTWERPE